MTEVTCEFIIFTAAFIGMLTSIGILLHLVLGAWDHDFAVKEEPGNLQQWLADWTLRLVVVISSTIALLCFLASIIIISGQY